MSIPGEGSLATALRFYDLYNRHDLSLLGDLLAEEYVGEVNGRVIRGRDGAREVIGAFLAAFPDVQYDVQDTVVEGRRVAARWQAVAMHRGPFAGVPPTGRRVTLTGLTLFHVEGERIVALWNVWDVHGLLEQLRAEPG